MMTLLAYLFLTAPSHAKFPCENKILSSSDRGDANGDFIVYLESLIDRRIIHLQDLEPFLNSLSRDELINPIPNRNTLTFEVHYNEFDHLIRTSTLNVRDIQIKLNTFIDSKTTTEKQKTKSEETTRKLPFYVAHDGSFFYQFSHPTLGLAYKILKPHGNYDNPSDWEKMIWPVSPLKNHKGFLIKFDADRFSSSDAEATCASYGEGIVLPTLEDMNQLLRHFSHTQLGTFPLGRLPKIMIAEVAKPEFQKLFTDLSHQLYKLSNDPSYRYGTRLDCYFSGQGLFTDLGDLSTTRLAVRCIDQLRHDSDGDSHPSK